MFGLKQEEANFVCLDIKNVITEVIRFFTQLDSKNDDVS